MIKKDRPVDMSIRKEQSIVFRGNDKKNEKEQRDKTKITQGVEHSDESERGGMSRES